jgi:thymidylate kinase
MHSLIVGMTESGKTSLAKNIARRLSNHGAPVMVLDILGSRWEGANYTTSDINEFMDYVKQARDCYIFIDESGEVGKLAKEFYWLATRSRHYGHSVFFITQRSNQMKPIIRAQCRQLFLFCSAKNDCKILYEDFNYAELLEANNLPQGTFFHAQRFGTCKKIKLF